MSAQAPAHASASTFAPFYVQLLGMHTPASSYARVHALHVPFKSRCFLHQAAISALVQQHAFMLPNGFPFLSPQFVLLMEPRLHYTVKPNLVDLRKPDLVDLRQFAMIHCSNQMKQTHVGATYLLLALDLETQCRKFRRSHSSTVIIHLHRRESFHCRARWPEFIFSIFAYARICSPDGTCARRVGSTVEIL